MPSVDAVARELRADDRDIGVRLGVALVASAPPRREQTEVFEVLRLLARDAGTAAELVDVDRLDALAHAARTTALALGRARRRELVADDAQRQELVALEAENRLEPL